MRIKRFKLNNHHEPASLDAHDYLLRDKDAKIAALNATVVNLNKTIRNMKNELALKAECVAHLNNQIELFNSGSGVSAGAADTDADADASSSAGPNKSARNATLISTYESLNSQLLEKLKLKEAENQALKTKVSLLQQHFFAQNGADPNNRISSMYSCTTSVSDPEKTNHNNSLSCSTSKTEEDADYMDEDDYSIQDSACFVSDLFDALPMINFDEEQEEEDEEQQQKQKKATAVSSPVFPVPIKRKKSVKPLTITTNSSTAAKAAAPFHHRKRSSVDSLLSLNKSAIRPRPQIKVPSTNTNSNSNSHSPTDTSSILNNTSDPKVLLRPSNSLRSLKNNSIRKVQKLSSYLSPASKEKPSAPSASATSSNPIISSPISARSSMYFGGSAEENDLEPSYTPVTPNSIHSVQFADISTKKIGCNPEVNTNALGMNLLNGSRILLQKSMEVIREK